jgi:hypothetical protein
MKRHFFAPLSVTVLFTVRDKSCSHATSGRKTSEIIKGCIVAPIDTENHADN